MTGGVFEVKTNRAKDLRIAAFIFGKSPRKEVAIIETSLWLSNNASKMVRNAKVLLTEKLGGKLTLMGKSAPRWAGRKFQYGSGKGLRCKRIRNNEKGFRGLVGISAGREEKCDWYGDFARGRFGNFWTWHFIAFWEEKPEEESAPNVFGEHEATYLRMGIKNAPNEFIGGWVISDGTRAFPGVTLGSNNYEYNIQDIFILPYRGKQMGEPSTEEGQFALRSELGGRGVKTPLVFRGKLYRK